ncbi:MAG: c-type cytochrome [Hyphomicrobiaceae bacterium]
MFKSILNLGTLVAIIGIATAGQAVISDQADAQMRGPNWRQHDFWQPGGVHRRHWGRRGRDAEMQARMRRHWTFMHEGVPHQYETARSTISKTDKVVAAGGKLYAEHCASCHGKTGLGDGAAGKSLTPSPALLAFMIQRPISVDPYLLWSISEGGKEFGTAMPAFKGVLQREEIWKIVAYMRAGFPSKKEDN